VADLTPRETGGSNVEPPASLSQQSSAYGFSAAGTALAGRRRGDRARAWWVAPLGFVLPVVLLVAWQVASGFVPSYRLPSPLEVVQAGVDLAQRGQLWPAVQISVQRVLLGFLFGSIVGLVVAAIVGLSRVGAALLSPSLGALRAVPSLAWLPLLILYLGIGENSKVLLVAIGAFFPVYTTVAGALRHVDPNLVEAGRAFGRHGVALLGVVQLPAVVPSIVSGLRLALAQSWLFLVAAELLGASMGLGYILSNSGSNGRIDQTFLSIVLLAVFGLVTDALVGVLERFLLRKWS
jgi:sulfonate transport system permease protein